MSERPLFKQCPSCQQFSPEGSGACLQCGHSFDSEQTHTETREVGEAEGQSRQPPEVSEVEPPKKKRGCLKKLGLGALIIVGLVIVLIVIASRFSDDFDDSAASVQSTSTPVPTFTTTPAGSTATETTDQSDTQAQAQPTRPQDPPPTSVPSTSAAPTVEEALLDFVICDRLRANLLMSWGQVPNLIYSDDPNVSGDIEPGDYVRFMMTEPDADGSIWIEVFPQDERAVGKTGNRVWIDWEGLVSLRLDQEMFTCEDSWASTTQEASPSTPVLPSATPAPRPMIEVNSLINVREGPGTNYGIVATAEAGQRFPIVGKNSAGDWWQITVSSGVTGWVYGPLVTPVNAANVQVVGPASDVEQSQSSTVKVSVGPGTHRVGIEIQAGIYVGQAGTDLWDSCYWARLSNLSGTDDILANENAQGLYYVEVLSSDRAFETECEVHPVENVSARSEYLTIVPTGTYLVGRDIGPGLYRGEAGTGLLESCYWARLSNLSGTDDILANENAEGPYYVEVLSSDRAFETECEIHPVENVSARSEYLTIVPTGTYLVGRDIGPGLYRGEAGTGLLESCYWARLSNLSGTDDILANENAEGTYFVEVLPSDYALQLECQVEKVE